MPQFIYFWYDENRQHIEEHGVSMDEFEAIVGDPLSTETSRSSDCLVAFGYAEDGRKLICVYEQLDDATILPITAYEVD